MKKFGIKIVLRDNNPMAAEHLLGPDWESYRWYHTEAERDAGYEDVIRRLPNYRKGDRPAEIVTKIEREHAA